MWQTTRFFLHIYVVHPDEVVIEGRMVDNKCGCSGKLFRLEKKMNISQAVNLLENQHTFPTE